MSDQEAEDREIAAQVLTAADLHGGSVFLRDLAHERLAYAVRRGWLAPAGIGHFEITEAGRRAGS